MRPFEKKLACTPLRDTPAEWRASILRTASREQSEIRNPWAAILSLLWPHPTAWGAIAACWIAIAILNVSGPRGAALYAVTPSGMNPVEVSAERYATYLRLRDSVAAGRYPEAYVLLIDRTKL